MIPITINKQDYLLPDTWDEISMAQYIELYRHRENLNEARLLSIFTGIDYGQVINFDLAMFESHIMPYMAAFDEEIKFYESVPAEKITVNGKTINVPQDIKLKTLGQKIMLQQRITMADKAQEDLMYLIPFAIATYIQTELSGGKYDDKEAEALIPHILKVPVTIAYPIGNFFLTRFIRSVGLKLKNSSLIHSPQRKPQVLTRLFNSETLTSSTRSVAAVS